MSNLPHKRVYKFFVDAKQYETSDTALSGEQIKNMAGVPAEYQLYLEEEGDTPDRQIADTDSISLDDRERHFFAVPPATFGLE